MPFRFFLAVLSFVLGVSSLSLSAPKKRLDIGLLLDKGGRDDKSFNQAAYEGSLRAQKEADFHLKVLESSDDSSLEPSLRTFAQHGYDLVIGIGFVQLGPMQKVAKEFPETHFLIIDSPLNLPNVRSIIFKEHEGSYLVGAIAALTSKTHTIGFIGGMDIPLIRRFELGYRSGAKAASPNVKIFTNYIGSSSDAWHNPTKAKELALAQFHKGADVIFQAAGASGLGVFEAAEQENHFAIGVDSNQDWMKPGHILTSMVKRVDLAVEQTILDEVHGKFVPGQFAWGLKEGAIDFSVDTNNRSILSPHIEKIANDLKAKIIAHQINVPDYYEVQKHPEKSR